MRQLQDLEFPMSEFVRSPLLGDAVREDAVGIGNDRERAAVIDNFPAKSKDGLLEAHGALKHK